MTLKRTIELLKEYLKMNNIIELTDTEAEFFRTCKQV